jgi:hypothetical protein
MARMIRRFKIERNDLGSDVILTTQDVEMVYEIIRGILYGIERDRNSVDLFEIQSGEDVQIFSIPKSKWRKALEKAISKMIEIEDYETCSDIKKAFESLP